MSSPRRLWKSFACVLRCSVRLVIRSVSRATWTSGLPVSAEAWAYSDTSAVLRSAVIDIGLLRGKGLQKALGLEPAIFEAAESDRAPPRHGPRQPAIGVGRLWNAAH